MKKDYIIFIAFLLAVVGSTSVKAQEDRTKSITQSYLRGWEYSLKAGFSIGGTAPLPLPEEINFGSSVSYSRVD